jgi:hypothetical protein
MDWTDRPGRPSRALPRTSDRPLCCATCDAFNDAHKRLALNLWSRTFSASGLVRFKAINWSGLGRFPMPSRRFDQEDRQLRGRLASSTARMPASFEVRVVPDPAQRAPCMIAPGLPLGPSSQGIPWAMPWPVFVCPSPLPLPPKLLMGFPLASNLWMNCSPQPIEQKMLPSGATATAVSPAQPLCASSAVA